ncbi:MAG: methenyltetrahydrofolate cyclohydrolase [Anaerolineales bacterium]|jgi:formiminotetrahydrofolate cyclodeaminase|nr:MAG: methenyltetrahydrofolate cyclohydrolase [Anaerolineales bacterium]
MFTEKSVDEFLDALASKEPAPGGGSGAALGGALAAALVSMVCNLTIGKKGYEDVQEPMADLLRKSEAIRNELPQLLEADTQVYGKVMAAYRQPRKTPEQKRARNIAMQGALKEATEVPLSIAQRCAQVVELSLPAAEMGNQWAVSDAGVGVLLADASMRAALLNVYINLSSIKDKDYVQQTLAHVETITGGKDEFRERVLKIVREKIGI